LVQDGETAKPLVGADVRISYPPSQDFRRPGNSYVKTGPDGIAHVSAAPFGNPGPVLEVSAAGYFAEEKCLPVETVQAIEAAGPSEKVDQRRVDLVVKLFAEPEPVVELILPSGYRGTVKAAVKIQEGVPCNAGQRCFSYEVPSSGVVQVTGGPLLKRVFGTDFRARYADGTSLTLQPKDSTVGWWWLSHEGNEYRFLVGTQMEYNSRCRCAEQEEQRGTPSRGGQGGGGQHHRRSSPSPSDSGLN